MNSVLAFCPMCNHDVTEEVHSAAHDGFEMPSTVTVSCSECGAEAEFAISWSVAIIGVQPSTDEFKGMAVPVNTGRIDANTNVQCEPLG